jgi:hypothetical protein
MPCTGLHTLVWGLPLWLIRPSLPWDVIAWATEYFSCLRATFYCIYIWPFDPCCRFGTALLFFSFSHEDCGLLIMSHCCSHLFIMVDSLPAGQQRCLSPPSQVLLSGQGCPVYISSVGSSLIPATHSAHDAGIQLSDQQADWVVSPLQRRNYHGKMPALT